MSDCMAFPETFDEFVESFGFVDSKEYYTNGSELIQVFRVKQWLENEAARKDMLTLPWSNETERLEADIERLKRLLAEEEAKYNECAKRFYKEGVKEFAEKVKANRHKLFFSVTGLNEQIDNLVKEMVGE